jgi:cysteinyl-tRNA synthetase
LLLSHHWQKPWNYEQKELAEVAKTAQILEKVAQKNPKLTNKQAQKLLPAFFKAMDENLDTPTALIILVNLATIKSLPAGRQAGELITKCGEILGLVF